MATTGSMVEPWVKWSETWIVLKPRSSTFLMWSRQADRDWARSGMGARKRKGRGMAAG